MGKGLVLISAHCGNWEIAAHLLKRLNVPVSVVGYENEIAHIRKYFDHLLKDRYFSVIAMGETIDGSLKIMNALARGEIVAMHADRHMSRQNEEVQFLGAPARFPTGPYIVAALSGAPLIHAFAMREGTYHYHFFAFPSERLVFTDRKERQRLLREWAARFAGRLEEILRKYPLQWKNFYDFWEDDQESIKLRARFREG
jgi:predicted LPLAT superfamily acyltransferase